MRHTILWPQVRYTESHRFVCHLLRPAAGRMGGWKVKGAPNIQGSNLENHRCYPPWNSHVCPWKWMVGTASFPLGKAYLSGVMFVLGRVTYFNLENVSIVDVSWCFSKGEFELKFDEVFFLNVRGNLEMVFSVSLQCWGDSNRWGSGWSGWRQIWSRSIWGGSGWGSAGPAPTPYATHTNGAFKDGDRFFFLEMCPVIVAIQTSREKGKACFVFPVRFGIHAFLGFVPGELG